MDRRISVSIRHVESPGSEPLSVIGEVWLGPLTEGDLFVVATDERGEDRAIRAFVAGMTSDVGIHVDEAERGAAVKIVLSGDGLDTIRPGDLLLGERPAKDA